MRAARAGSSVEKQQQHREQDAEHRRTARDQLSEEQQEQRCQQNAEQHQTSRDELSSNQLKQFRIQNAAQHKSVWDALTQKQRELILQKQQMRRTTNSRNAARTQDSIVNDNGEYLSHYMTSHQSAHQLANHEQCPVWALLLLLEEIVTQLLSYQCLMIVSAVSACLMPGRSTQRIDWK